ncbi:Putative hemoglobin [Fulvivirga imtechensis AK7]|uniref:Putative hemoglobin n=2 Tax=Fulvivirga TaxID=396811 RepID=L8JSF6_9BACT|nr:Putative hemoglobin [Fulvivirga imtechensis AK7]
MIFYDRLFDIAPEVRPLFKGNIKDQSQKLTLMISFAIDKLEQFDLIVKDIEALGRRHSRYNVKEEHYQIVGQALLWTLEKGAGDIWSKEHEEAWTALYGILAATMTKAQISA